MADQADVPDQQKASQETSLPVPSPTSRRKVMVLLGVVLLVLVLLGIAGAYFLFLGGKPREEAPAARVVPAAIGPRSILEGLDKLQMAYFQAQKTYSADLAQLVADMAKDEKAYSAAWKAAVMKELGETNLVVRVLPDGFEFALRQDEKKWLVYSRWGAGAPKIATQETDGSPPFGGAAALAEAPASKPATAIDLEEYKEPQDYFSVILPKGYEVNHSGPGPSVRVSFSYTNDVRLTVKAMESNRGWEPLTELSVKAEQIRSGGVPAFSDFRLAVTNLLDVEGGTGYEMGLVGVGNKAGVYTHTFALGGERTLLSVAVLCPSQAGKELYDIILTSLRDTLRIGMGPGRKSAVVHVDKGAKMSATDATNQPPPAPPPLTPEEEKQWLEAKALLKTTGIMRSGDAYVAIVNGQLVRVGDTVAVNIKNKPFKFTIAEITVDEVKFDRVLKGDNATATDKKTL